MPWSRCTAALLAIGLGMLAARAQEQPSEEPLVNFVFASQLGSGIYASGDNVVQVYRIPIDWNVVPLEDGRSFGVRMRFPATLGFYDFRTLDLLEGKFPDTVSTLTLIAGSEFLVPAGEHWLVKPRADVGYASDLAQDVHTPIYAVGIRTEGTYPWKVRTALITNQIVWAGQSDADRALADDFLRVETSVDVRTPIPWTPGGRAVDIGTFAASYVYFDSVRFFRFPQDVRVASTEEIETDPVITQWEVGFTLGITPNKVWRLPLPRVGLSYRFGSDPQSFRLVFGGAF